MKILLLVNPAAGGGAAKRQAAKLARALANRGVIPQLAQTEGPGDAVRLIHSARREGTDCVAVVGGDGTLNEVSQAYLTPDGEVLPGPDLALVPCGTGGDFRKSFGMSKSIIDAATRIVGASTKVIDLGILELTAHNGRPLRRAFLNITSFGIGGLTDRIVNQGSKWLGGRTAFFIGALRALVNYRNASVKVEVDGQLFLDSPIVNVALANGQYFGGGMKIAPDADPSDGQLDVIGIGDLNRIQNLGLAPHLYRGTHLHCEGVTATRGRNVRAIPSDPTQDVFIDMDGETPGKLPLTASLRPGAVRLRI